MPGNVAAAAYAANHKPRHGEWMAHHDEKPPLRRFNTVEE